MRKRRKPRTLEVVLIMIAFGIAAVANALARPDVSQEVAETLARVKQNLAVVSILDEP